MLRITRTESAEGMRLHLEGRLAEADLAVMKASLSAHAPKEITLDLSELRWLDGPARAWLSGLIAAGAQLAGCSPFIERLLSRANGTSEETE
jgi:hypothetical protein